MNPTIATLLTTSVTVIAAIMVLVLIFLVPVLLQARRTAHEAGKLIGFRTPPNCSRQSRCWFDLSGYQKHRTIHSSAG